MNLTKRPNAGRQKGPCLCTPAWVWGTLCSFKCKSMSVAFAHLILMKNRFFWFSCHNTFSVSSFAPKVFPSTFPRFIAGAKRLRMPRIRTPSP